MQSKFVHREAQVIEVAKIMPKTFELLTTLSSVPDHFIPRGSPARAASHGKLDHNAALAVGRDPGNRIGTLPALQLDRPAPTFVTQ